MIGRNDVALKFFHFARQVRNSWSDAYYGEAVAYFKLD
jgi:hypothetical protein